ncbi:MAG: hypothetical protein H7122_18460, partial [Chitinophagaceae bacterium]|nr:hypothetical protein [Chitinophagaceae bacterium]
MKKLVIQLILFLFCGFLHAQQAFTNYGNLQIHTGTSMAGFGNFSNETAATLVNNGSFYIRGNLTNDQSSMSVGAGTLYLNGSVAQSVNGTQPFRTLNFVTDNNLGITLNNTLSVSGAHTYTNGIITTSSTPDYLVYEAGSSYSGESNSS